ncbi:MAG: homoserine O-acetyltransferase [Rickettsiales bacterium]
MQAAASIIDHEEITFGPSKRPVEIGRIIRIAKDEPLKLASGAEIRDFPLAFQTTGILNAAKSNAILICHALTGDQYVTGEHPVTGKPGWWEKVVGPGKVIDTNRFFIISTNVLGGCVGSFGPKHNDPKTGKAYGLDFPVITMGDIVRAQKLLVEALGIETLFAVIGGSMGGMQVLEWAARFPESLRVAVPIATAARHSAQNIAFHEIGRQAVMADPDWKEGRYMDYGTFPRKGLAVARMTAHVTYLSESTLQRKFGRMLQDKEAITFGFEADFQVESYLRHQGKAFVERFDPNSYLYITRATDYFDIAADHGQGSLAKAFQGNQVSFCIVSFSTDWLYPTSESRAIVRALNAVGGEVSFSEIKSDRGHDAFLLDEPEFWRVMNGFLDGKARMSGL